MIIELRNKDMSISLLAQIITDTIPSHFCYVMNDFGSNKSFLLEDLKE